MEATASSKIIAEFMSCENPQAWELIPSPYECDWNWLMEVVEKIESLELYKGSVIIQELNCIIWFDRKMIICVKHAETKKEAVYNACVEFIKWYNQQKQTK